MLSKGDRDASINSTPVTVTFIWLLSYSLFVVLHLIIRFNSNSMAILHPGILHLTVLFSFSSFPFNAFQALFPVKRRKRLKKCFLTHQKQKNRQRKKDSILYKPNLLVLFLFLFFLCHILLLLLPPVVLLL